ncbi:SUN domain-containing protein 3-like isoform X2 [Fundulus heteroclitus]|uniref:SUN domain-containing protein 3-like isoform X2 n=1 Tax=Fundulus heteroclitus TaxID=8078 RepID=UPI00165C448A|nr:SUN domain-containing protein 3-like isoform X2 [Fundulus heteroclitus]
MLITSLHLFHHGPSSRRRKRLPDQTETTEVPLENSSSSNEDPMKYTLKHFCLSVIFISLYYGFTCLIPDYPRPSVSSPATINTVSVPAWADKLKELEEELLRLKNMADYLLPTADSLPNFALESQGAKVFGWKSSDTYKSQEVVYNWFGFSIRRPGVGPGVVIQGKSRMLPGRCWAFAGSRGHLTIALSHRVTISHVTLGHLPKFLSPTGTIGSSPREFSVYGKRDLEDEGTLLGTFLYDEDGNQLQTFKLPVNMNPNDLFIFYQAVGLCRSVHRP